MTDSARFQVTATVVISLAATTLSSACCDRDGVVDSTLGESCDDGNTTPGDGCDGSCNIE